MNIYDGFCRGKTSGVSLNESLFESASGLDWPSKGKRHPNTTRKHYNSYELLHVFVILFLTELKRAKFSVHLQIKIDQRHEIGFQQIQENIS